MRLIEDTIDTAFMTAGKAALSTGKAVFSVTSRIFSGMQVSRKYKKALAASGINRNVFVAREIDHKSLLLNDDPDYDDVGVCDIQGQEYIYGGKGAAEKIIVSGGSDEERSRAYEPFIVHSAEEGIPLLVIANSNCELETMIRSIMGRVEVISSDMRAGNCYYNIFGGMNVHDIVSVLISTMKDKAERGTEMFLLALADMLIRRDGTLSMQSLSSYHLPKLQNDIDALYASRTITESEHEELSDYCRAGSSSRGSLALFLKEAGHEFKNVFGYPSSKKSNIKAVLRSKGAVIINAGDGLHEKAISLTLNHLKQLRMKGIGFNMLVDNFPLYKYPDFRDILRGITYSAGHEDFIASMTCGDDDLFRDLTSKSITILFRHSGKSCSEWSEYLGTYTEIKPKSTLAQSGSIFDFHPSKAVADDEHDKPRISSATLSLLPDYVACIQRHHEIVIACV